MDKSYRQLMSMGWNPRTILDIGAFKGHWTRNTRTYFPNARYTLIEPNDNVELRTLKDRIFNQIVSDSEKDALWFSNGSTGDSLFHERTKHYTNVLPITRKTTTLDKLFPGETFDFVKIDCQGGEVDIINGGVDTLSRTSSILLEMPFAGQYNKGAPIFAEYIRKLDGIGFAPFDIVEHHYVNNILIQIDMIFLRKSSPLWIGIQSKIT